MALPAFRSKGAFGSGTSSCTVAVPTGGGAPQANDILIIVVESSNSTTAAGTPSTPAGYSKIFEETQASGATGVTTLTVFAKRAVGGEGNVTISGTGHVAGEMFVYSGCVTSGTAWTVGQGSGSDTGNGTILGLNTPVDECLVLLIVSTTRDAAATDTTFSAWTNANLSSITEREDRCTSSGSGGGFGIADGGKATAGATGNSTVTIAVSDKWRSVAIALSPVASGISGTLSKTQEGDSVAATGTVLTHGTLSATQANNTSSATGALRNQGVASATQAGDTISSAGKVLLLASLSVTQEGNTISASGVGSVAITGTLSVTQASNTISASGVLVQGDEPDDPEPPPPPPVTHRHKRCCAGRVRRI